MFSIFLWMLVGYVVVVSHFFVSNYTEDDPNYEKLYYFGEVVPFCKQWCGPVTIRYLVITPLMAASWPIISIITIFMYWVILYRHLNSVDFWNFLNRELFNPCDLFKKKVKVDETNS